MSILVWLTSGISTGVFGQPNTDALGTLQSRSKPWEEEEDQTCYLVWIIYRFLEERCSWRKLAVIKNSLFLSEKCQKTFWSISLAVLCYYFRGNTNESQFCSIFKTRLFGKLLSVKNFGVLLKIHNNRRSIFKPCGTYGSFSLVLSNSVKVEEGYIGDQTSVC